MNLNWISKLNKNLIKLFFYNIIIFTILYIIVASIFYYINKKLEENVNASKGQYNSSTIRATYPTYKNFKPEVAIKIFEEYSAAKTEYKPFIAYRRKGFSGEVVNIGKDNGFRKSTNHDVNNSVWFFGGSTMWGTGATDNTTIPSYVAKLSGQNVLNLGESGYTSFQELINLEMMIVNGYKPKMVFFYDGQNDGYRYCQKNEPLPSHAYYTRYQKMINQYRDYKKNMNELAKYKDNIVKHMSFTEIINKKFDFFGSIYSFLYSPFEYFDKSKYVNTLNKKRDLENNIPFSKFKKENSYLICEKESNANRAANVTVSSWLFAYEILKKYDIPVRFILQPTAVYNPSKYNLDYLINGEKQRIADELDNYTMYYTKVRETWNNECLKYGACNSFLDLSDIFYDNKKPIFIDACHVAPRGNEIIAKEIIKKVEFK